MLELMNYIIVGEMTITPLQSNYQNMTIYGKIFLKNG